MEDDYYTAQESAQILRATERTIHLLAACIM